MVVVLSDNTADISSHLPSIRQYTVWIPVKQLITLYEGPTSILMYYKKKAEREKQIANGEESTLISRRNATGNVHQSANQKKPK